MALLIMLLLQQNVVGILDDADAHTQSFLLAIRSATVAFFHPEPEASAEKALQGPAVHAAVGLHILLAHSPVGLQHDGVDALFELVRPGQSAHPGSEQVSVVRHVHHLVDCLRWPLVRHRLCVLTD